MQNLDVSVLKIYGSTNENKQMDKPTSKNQIPTAYKYVVGQSDQGTASLLVP